jgi:PAS domain S-box-containing protein
MDYNFTFLCYIRFLSGIIALVLVGFLWKRRHLNEAGYLLLFELAASIWAVGDGFEAAAISLQQKLFWSQFAYIGVTTISVMFLLFVLSYTNLSRLVNLKSILLLLVIPLITLIMAFSNPVHGLLWAKIIILQGSNNTVYYYGPYFWVHVIYSYSILAAGIFILLVDTFRVYPLYKAQIWLLIFGSLLPFCASITYVFKLLPVKGLDPTPISFILTGLIIAISLYWFKLFDIMPLARKQVINNLRDGMFVVNSKNRIVDANPAFCSIIGTSPDQVIGTLADMTYKKLNIDIDNFSSVNDFTHESQIIVNGDLHDFEIKCHQVMSNNHTLLGNVFLLTDFTTKKMILDAISDSNKRRKIEISEKEKLIIDLDAYARTVAHDLKNPISSVVYLSELIKISLSENKMNEALDLIDMVQNHGEKMVRIIDDLLILSVIRKENININPIDIGTILTDVFKRLDEEIISCKASFEMPDHWPKVLGHTQWIEEVLVNLISNAIKYGGTPPFIRLGFNKETSSIYRFWVHDNGNGLSQESLKKIFIDFERLGRTDIQGHGLGLSIVKRIIEKIGGSVKVESTNKPGEGCIFSFTLQEENQSQQK